MYPPDQRQRFGPQMRAVFRDMTRAAIRTAGWRGVGGLWLRELRDLFGSAAAAWAAAAKALMESLLGRWARPSEAMSGVKERVMSLWESTARDVHYGLRGMLRHRLYSAIVVLTVALGVGANATIFSVVNAVLLSPLPYDGADRIVMVWEDFSAQGGPAQEWIEVPNFFEWKRQSPAWQTLSAFMFDGVNLFADDEPERLTIGNVSHDFFATFAVEPAIGRGFLEEDDIPNAPRVVVLSHELWQRRFGFDASILGTSIVLDDELHVVVGVLPAGFETPLSPQTDVYRPLRLDSQSADRGNFFLQAVGRLREDVPLARATAEMNTIMAGIGDEFSSNKDVKIQLVPLLDQLVQPVRRAILVLWAVVGAVLLIACANIANLALGRGAGRESEIAIRAAVGAGRARLVRQLVTESTTIALVGGAVGLLLAHWGIPLLVALSPLGTPRIGAVALDPAVVAFTLVVATMTGLAFGIVPALRSSRPDASLSLREGGGSRGSQSASSSRRVRSLLVVSEIALALILVIASGLLIRSFGRLLAVDPGFRSENLVAARLTLPASRYERGPQLVAFLSELMERVRQRPGVDSASAVSVLPLSGNDTDTGFFIEGRPVSTRPRDTPTAWFRRVASDYFQTLGIPTLNGREFTGSDLAHSPSVVIINEVTAARYWPGENVVGKRVRFGGPELPWSTVIGVVGGVRHGALDREPRAELYFPYAQRPGSRMTIVVRSRNDVAALAQMLRTEIAELDPQLPLSSLTTMDALVDASLAQSRFFMTLTAGFALLALLLAALGVYGVMSYNVSRRSGEMGVRLALGARRSDVLTLVLREGATLTLAGIVLGLVGAFWLTQWLSNLLFAVDPRDASTFLVALLGTVLVALAACLLPALRATRVDPLRSLRHS
jgi:putative ABC transport system permease protein